jgi:transposase InsO family protein
MGHVRHRGARTTKAIRREIQQSQQSLRALAKYYGINPKTVAKWKKRNNTDDLPTGPKTAQHRKLTAEEEDIIVRFREHTLLPLDDCLYALQARIPHLSRSSLHRCLQRHGISRLAETVKTGDWADKREATPIGCIHIDRTEVQSTEGSHYLFNAMDQASKFVFVWMGAQGGPAEAAAFLAVLTASLPFRIDQVLTLDAEPFASGGGETEFTRACREREIKHRLTSSPHPWTRGRVARMERTIRESVTFASEAYLARLLQDFVHAYNYRRRLKTLRGLTPHDFICDAWRQEPQRFLRDPHHEMLGPEIVPSSSPSGI